jgi:hypothetical protein
MGSTTWIDVYGRSGAETHRDMNVLNRLDEELDVLAAKLGVAKITSFYDYRELIIESGAVETEWPAPVWFDSGDGLATFAALHKILASDWHALNWKPEKSTDHWPASLMEHLSFCQSILEEAVLSESKFRLMIVG